MQGWAEAERSGWLWLHAGQTPNAAWDCEAWPQQLHDTRYAGSLRSTLIVLLLQVNEAAGICALRGVTGAFKLGTPGLRLTLVISQSHSSPVIATILVKVPELLGL